MSMHPTANKVLLIVSLCGVEVGARRVMSSVRCASRGREDLHGLNLPGGLWSIPDRVSAHLQIHLRRPTVKRFFLMLAAVSLSTAALAAEARTINILAGSGWREHAGERSEPERDCQLHPTAWGSNGARPHTQMLPKSQKTEQRPTPAAAPQEGDKAPLMVSFTELKWVELPERKGMQFAVLSGDPKMGAYT